MVEFIGKVRGFHQLGVGLARNRVPHVVDDPEVARVPVGTLQIIDTKEAVQVARRVGAEPTRVWANRIGDVRAYRRIGAGEREVLARIAQQSKRSRDSQKGCVQSGVCADRETENRKTLIHLLQYRKPKRSETVREVRATYLELTEVSSGCRDHEHLLAWVSSES